MSGCETDTSGYILLYVMTIEWTNIIISGLVSKGFSVSAGFDPGEEDELKGKIHGNDSDKISHVICLRIQRKIPFTREQIVKDVGDVLKNNNISIFGGIVSFSGNFNLMNSTIEKTKIDHPYR